MPNARAARVTSKAEPLSLIQIYQKAERDIIDAVSYKKRRGYVDYSEQAALARVRAILDKMLEDSRERVPRLVSASFSENTARAMGYKNAFALTSEQTAVVKLLTDNLLANITEAAAVTVKNIQSAYSRAKAISRDPPEMAVGRLRPDEFRAAGLTAVAAAKASGGGIRTAEAEFMEIIGREGIVSFTDKSGKKWPLTAYANMAVRTTSNQATTAAAILADPDRDLYRIVGSGSACPICSKYEGRVYSRSGKNPRYPPMARAFGKIDPNGPDDLTNSYLTIHPNCTHRWAPFTESGRSEAELAKLRERSGAPFDIDPRTEAQREAWRNKVNGRAKLMGEYKEWQKMRAKGVGTKTFTAYQRNRRDKTEEYKKWKEAVRQT
jgi:hypothetical protein